MTGVLVLAIAALVAAVFGLLWVLCATRRARDAAIGLLGHADAQLARSDAVAASRLRELNDLHAAYRELKDDRNAFAQLAAVYRLPAAGPDRGRRDGEAL